MRASRIVGITFAVLCTAATFAASPAAAQPLSTDPATYFILGRDEVRLKDFQIETGPACNIGVNNAGGLLRNTDGSFSSPLNQIGADNCGAAGGDIAQCFCNAGGGKFDETCVGFPGILLDETLATYIAACNTMPGGDFPMPCVAGVLNVTADDGKDCVPLAADSNAGNMRCDLPPGDYGHIEVNRKAALSLDGGVYNIASYHADRDTILLTTNGQSTVNVCGDDEFDFGDKGAVIGECGSLRLNYISSVGAVNLGNRKNNTTADMFMTLHVCAPQAEIKLSRHNNLEGNFFANFASSDFGNRGRCCEVAQAGLCACFDVVAPASVQVGDDLTLSGGCDLSNVSAVTVCGVDCPISMQDDTQIVCTVPDPGVALPTACDVVGVSGTGEFKSNTQVTVTP
jgi:hypothetical protein